MERLKKIFLKDLQKLGIYKHEGCEYFFTERPQTIFSDGRTIFWEDGCYHIIGTDRGEVVGEEIFENLFEANYYLLEYYVAVEAGRIVAEKMGEEYHLYRDLFFEKQIELFHRINVQYGKRRAEEIQKLLSQESD